MIVSDKRGFVGNSQNSGGDHLLCSACEATLAKQYDQYAFARLKRLQLVASDLNLGREIELDHGRMAGFILSLFWRCSISSNEMYKSFEFPNEVEELQKNALRSNSSPFDLGAFSLHRLTDNEKQFPDAVISEMIVGPFIFHGEDRKRRRFIGAFVVFQGFAFSFVMPKRTIGGRRQPGYLRAKGTRFSAIQLHMQRFPPLWEFLRSAVASEQRKNINRPNS